MIRHYRAGLKPVTETDLVNYEAAKRRGFLRAAGVCLIVAAGFAVLIWFFLRH